MAKKPETVLPTIIERRQKDLLDAWLQQQRNSGAWTAEDEGDTKSQSTRFLAELRKATAAGQIEDIQAREWSAARELLEEVSRARALRGFTPVQTATFVFSLKEPLFTALREEMGKDAQRLADEVWVATLLLDKLGLYTTEVFQKNREEMIARQQAELLELSTPVVQLWEGILAIPLIGTLDSERTQVVMENLLQEIVKTGAEIAIIDITGVPTVDTLVAQHLLKTVSAARLMGADCIISGIRPQIAQTIVHLGVDLSVTSKANMADAFELALRRVGKTVVDRAKPAQARAE
ncbi:MAG TPA: STAS domain-containing protein [Stellaceae bacterium]|nr:STAS domain-containing protein [Stellaceae bacterium]